MNAFEDLLNLQWKEYISSLILLRENHDAIDEGVYILWLDFGLGYEYVFGSFEFSKTRLIIRNRLEF